MNSLPGRDPLVVCPKPCTQPSFYLKVALLKSGEFFLGISKAAMIMPRHRDGSLLGEGWGQDVIECWGWDWEPQEQSCFSCNQIRPYHCELSFLHSDYALPKGVAHQLVIVLSWSCQCLQKCLRGSITALCIYFICVLPLSPMET